MNKYPTMKSLLNFDEETKLYYLMKLQMYRAVYEDVNGVVEPMRIKEIEEGMIRGMISFYGNERRVGIVDVDRVLRNLQKIKSPKEQK